MVDIDLGDGTTHLSVTDNARGAPTRLVTFNGETPGLMLGRPVTHKLHVLPALTVFPTLAQRHMLFQVTLGIWASAIRSRAERMLAELAEAEPHRARAELSNGTLWTSSAATVARLDAVPPLSSSSPPCFG